jgi:GDP-L-fucose synthase
MREPVRFLVDNFEIGKNNVVLSAVEAGINAASSNLGSSCMYPRSAPKPLREDLILKGELEPTTMKVTRSQNIARYSDSVPI